MKTETVEICEVCETPLAGDLDRIETSDPYGISTERFTFVRCPGCRSWIQTPRPHVSELGPFYDNEFLQAVGAEPTSWLQRLTASLNDFNLYHSELRWILKHLPRGARYLDYSGGNGQVARLVQRYRPDVDLYVTEFSERFRQFLKQHVAEDHVAPDIGDFDPELQFDLISALGVLEHVPSPTAFLASLRERLNTGGQILMTVPNPESLQRRIRGERWWNWQSPRHMYLMPVETIVGLLEQNGFKVVETRGFLMRYNTLSLVLSFFPQWHPYKATRLQVVALGLLSYGSLPLEAVAAGFGRGGMVGVLAQKT